MGSQMVETSRQFGTGRSRVARRFNLAPTTSRSAFDAGKGRRTPRGSLQPIRVGEGRYLVFLLLMAGFWTSFNQIFMTLPEYIRDYVDTTDLVPFLESGPVWWEWTWRPSVSPC